MQNLGEMLHEEEAVQGERLVAVLKQSRLGVTVTEVISQGAITFILVSLSCV
jgi:hypothetical protein